MYVKAFNLLLGNSTTPTNEVDTKPGCQGIALRLPEWNKLKESIVKLHEAMPALAKHYYVPSASIIRI